NIVTNAVGIPHAVLIRALQPVEGIDLMLERRNLAMPSANLARGPGSAAKAMGINLKQNGLSLSKQNNIWIERPLNTVDSKNICAGPRIGVNYAAEDALLPYRFWIKGNACVSKK